MIIINSDTPKKGRPHKSLTLSLKNTVKKCYDTL